MKFHLFKRITHLPPGDSIKVELQPAPDPAPGQSSFDQARDFLGLPPWWKDEWFLPGSAISNEAIQQAKDEWLKQKGN